MNFLELSKLKEAEDPSLIQYFAESIPRREIQLI